MLKSLAILAMLAPISVIHAQPQEVLDFHNRLDGGELIIHFCSEPSRSWLMPWRAPVAQCEDRKAIIYGQVCDSGAAKTMGAGESGNVEGGLPNGMKYAGFYCQKGGRLHTPDERVFGGGNWMN